MKKITLLFLLMIPFIGIGQNLAPNPTLNGSTSWSNLNPGTNQAYDATLTRTADGSGSWIITSNGTFNSGIKSANIAAGSLAAGDYTFKYYVYGAAGYKTKPVVRDNGASKNLNGETYTIQASDTWELVEQTFTLSGTGTANIRAMVNSDDVTTSFNVDDISFTYIPPSGNTLMVNKVGAGTVALTLDKISYEDTDNETLTANPAVHWNFDSWSGDLSGTTNPETLLMDADKTVTANFTIDPTFKYDFNFDTDGELEGWTMDPQVTVKSHTGGLVTLSIVEDQWSRLNLFDFPIPTATYNKLTVVLKNEEASTNQFGVTLGPNNETQVFTLLNQAAFQTFEIDLSTFTDWTGDVTSLRLRFADDTNTEKTGRPSTSHDVVIDSVVFSYVTPLSTNDNLIQDFSIYPNPVNNKVNIVLNNNNISKVQLYNILGKKVLETKSLKNNSLNVSSLNSGVYFLKIYNTENKSATKKIIIN